MIDLLDYGMGNLRSVQKAFEYLGHQVRLVDSVRQSERLVIPGVGAFGAAMEKIASLRADLVSFARAGNPILGICLGQQLLFDESEEYGTHQGLGLIPGKVRYFPGDLYLKIPHIGWSALEAKDSVMGNGLQTGDQAYFVHSLVTHCEEEAHVGMTSTYGIEFAAAVRHENVWGMQFHPEKSSQVGMQLLKNWINYS